MTPSLRAALTPIPENQMLQPIGIETANANRISEFGIICLWSTFGLLLTEVLHALGFGAQFAQAMLTAG